MVAPTRLQEVLGCFSPLGPPDTVPTSPKLAGPRRRLQDLDWAPGLWRPSCSWRGFSSSGARILDSLQAAGAEQPGLRSGLLGQLGIVKVHSPPTRPLHTLQSPSLAQADPGAGKGRCETLITALGQRLWEMAPREAERPEAVRGGKQDSQGGLDPVLGTASRLESWPCAKRLGTGSPARRAAEQAAEHPGGICGLLICLGFSTTCRKF